MTWSCSKHLSALLREIMSKHDGHFYSFNYLHSVRTKNKPELHKYVYENKDFCSIAMPSEDTKILELDQYQKYDKTPFTIYVDLESLIEKS